MLYECTELSTLLHPFHCTSTSPFFPSLSQLLFSRLFHLMDALSFRTDSPNGRPPSLSLPPFLSLSPSLSLSHSAPQAISNVMAVSPDDHRVLCGSASHDMSLRRGGRLGWTVSGFADRFSIVMNQVDCCRSSFSQPKAQDVGGKRVLLLDPCATLTTTAEVTECPK